jgi:hypothetical protein
MATNLHVYDDDHITVRDLGFDPTSGKLKLAIDEKHPSVGSYFIAVTFDSGNHTRIPYDGASPNRNKDPIAQTYKPNDSVKEIKVVPVPN